jgi:succinate-acetate transporter protein
MFPLLMMLFQQPQLRATQPNYFFPVVVLLLIAGGVAWLIAAVLGFARSPAFGPSARWFSYAAVCLLIYHLHFLLFGIFAVLGISQNSVDLSMALGVGAFFNLFVVLGAVCAIMGFIRMTDPR